MNPCSASNKKVVISDDFAQKIEETMVPKPLGHEVLLTMILPVFNCSERIGYTLDSLLRQNYPRLEVIVVDAGSTDRTLEVVSGYYPLITRIYSVTDYNVYDMINRGIPLASGRYITALFPGSYYLSDHALMMYAHAAMENNFPELIYAGTIQRVGEKSPRQILSPLNKEVLSRGISPAPLIACWFRPDLFENIGKFRTDLTMRSSFEYLCRFAKYEDLKWAMVPRILVDYDIGRFSYKKVIPYALETWQIICAHFGARKAFRFLSQILWPKSMGQ